MRPRTTVTTLVGVAASAMILTGCSASGAASQLSSDRATSQHCVSKRGVDDIQLIDGTVKDPWITSKWRASITQHLRPAVICANGGSILVGAFSSTRGDIQTIAQSVITLPGSETNAKLLHVNEKLKPLLDDVDRSWKGALSAVPSGGSDPVGILGSLAEHNSVAASEHRRLNATVYTDGLQNVGIDLSKSSLTETQANKFASAVAVPSLKGADVAIVGVGTTDGKPVKSSVIDALVTFWRVVCKRTDATCAVSSELPQ